MTIENIFSFAGRAGSGKGFACDDLIDNYGFKKLSFADLLREISFSMLGLSYEEGMKQYDKMKLTELYNKQTLRNFMENLGAKLRTVDVDIFVKNLINKVKELQKSPTLYNICIDDLRYDNEYFLLKDFCLKNGINFKLIFKDYKSNRYDSNNTHESAAMANYLVNKGFKDNDILNDFAIEGYRTSKVEQKN